MLDNTGYALEIIVYVLNGNELNFVKAENLTESLPVAQ